MLCNKRGWGLQVGGRKEQRNWLWVQGYPFSERAIEKEHWRDVRFAHEKASENSVAAEIRRKAPKEHRRTQCCLLREARPTTSGSSPPG